MIGIIQFLPFCVLLFSQCNACAVYPYCCIWCRSVIFITVLYCILRMYYNLLSILCFWAFWVVLYFWLIQKGRAHILNSKKAWFYKALMAWPKFVLLVSSHFLDFTECSSLTKLSVVASSCLTLTLFLAFEYCYLFLEYLFPTIFALMWVIATRPLNLSLDAPSCRKQSPGLKPLVWVIRLHCPFAWTCPRGLWAETVSYCVDHLLCLVQSGHRFCSTHLFFTI